MEYKRLAEAYTQIESTSGLLEKTEILSSLLKDTPPKEVSRVVALTLGKLHPDWTGSPEIGIAEKTAIQVVAAAASVSETRVKAEVRKTGDIGAAAEVLLASSAQGALIDEESTAAFVYETLDATAKTSGQGSSREKTAKLNGAPEQPEPS